MVKQFRSQWTLSQLYAGQGGINPRTLIRKDSTGKNNVKELMGTAIGGMAGMGAIGAMNGIPGMPANNVGATVGAGVNLANIGNVAKIGMNIIPKGKKTKK